MNDLNLFKIGYNILHSIYVELITARDLNIRSKKDYN